MKAEFLSRNWHFLSIIAMLIFLVAHLYVSLQRSRDNEREMSRRAYESERTRKAAWTPTNGMTHIVMSNRVLYSVTTEKTNLLR